VQSKVRLELPFGRAHFYPGGSVSTPWETNDGRVPGYLTMFLEVMSVLLGNTAALIGLQERNEKGILGLRKSAMVLSWLFACKVGGVSEEILGQV
jgi:hypothetical protein